MTADTIIQFFKAGSFLAYFSFIICIILSLLFLFTIANFFYDLYFEYKKWRKVILFFALMILSLVLAGYAYFIDHLAPLIKA